MYKTTTEVISLESRRQQAPNETLNVFVNCRRQTCAEQMFIFIQLN